MKTASGKVCEFVAKNGTAAEVIQEIQNHRNATCNQFEIMEYYSGDFIHDYEFIMKYQECNKFVLMCSELATHTIALTGDYFNRVFRTFELVKDRKITGYFLLTRISDTELRAKELSEDAMENWIDIMLK